MNGYLKRELLMGRVFQSVTLCVLVLALAGSGRASSQESDQDLRAEIEALKQGQQQILQDVPIPIYVLVVVDNYRLDLLLVLTVKRLSSQRPRATNSSMTLSH